MKEKSPLRESLSEKEAVFAVCRILRETRVPALMIFLPESLPQRGLGIFFFREKGFFSVDLSKTLSSLTGNEERIFFFNYPASKPVESFIREAASFAEKAIVLCRGKLNSKLFFDGQFPWFNGPFDTSNPSVGSFWEVTKTGGKIKAQSILPRPDGWEEANSRVIIFE